MSRVWSRVTIMMFRVFLMQLGRTVYIYATFSACDEEIFHVDFSCLCRSKRSNFRRSFVHRSLSGNGLILRAQNRGFLRHFYPRRKKKQSNRNENEQTYASCKVLKRDVYYFPVTTFSRFSRYETRQKERICFDGMHDFV